MQFLNFASSNHQFFPTKNGIVVQARFNIKVSLLVCCRLVLSTRDFLQTEI